MDRAKPLEWRAVPGFDGYEVRENGQVRSWLRPGPGMRRGSVPREKRPQRGLDGRLYVQVRGPRGWERMPVDELVAAACQQEERRSA